MTTEMRTGISAAFGPFYQREAGIAGAGLSYSTYQFMLGSTFSFTFSGECQQSRREPGLLRLETKYWASAVDCGHTRIVGQVMLTLRSSNVDGESEGNASRCKGAEF